MKWKPKQSEQWALFGGLALTVSGVAHLVCPPAFEPVNRLAFKNNIRAHVLINGSIEAALGLALLNSRTRRPALARHTCLPDLFQRQPPAQAARLGQLITLVHAGGIDRHLVGWPRAAAGVEPVRCIPPTGRQHCYVA